jgi:hypothetical protein
MAAARIIYPPMSGRDRRHYTAELRKAESEYRRLTCEAAAAHEAAERQFAEAHRLDCLAWSALQFTGGPEAPSPTIAAALHGGVEILECSVGIATTPNSSTWRWSSGRGNDLSTL